MTASVVAHAAVLLTLFISMPAMLPPHAAAVIPVRLVPAVSSPASASSPVHRPPVPRASKTPKAPVHRRAVAAVEPKRRSPAPAPMQARAKPQPKPVRRREARADVARHASPPSVASVAEASAHDLDRVRQHLERFKYYPEDARRRGIGGNVDVRFRLTDGGQATHVRIASSSGYALLDHAAKAIVARAVPFPVDRGHYRVRLRFWP